MAMIWHSGGRPFVKRKACTAPSPQPEPAPRASTSMGGTGRRPKERRKWSPAVTALCVAAGLFLARCNFGSTPSSGVPPNGVSLANNQWHGVVLFPFGDPAGLRAHLFPMMQAYDTFSDLIVTEEFSVNASDVVAFEAPYGFGGSPIGWVNCPPNAIVTGTDPNRTCYGQTMIFDTSGIPLVSQHQLDAIMCHELGHTVGLRHVNPAKDGSDWNSCMQATIAESTPASLSQHDFSHINLQY